MSFGPISALDSRFNSSKYNSIPAGYRGCQKNVPIEDLFSATTPYAAILFSEHYYDKRYKTPKHVFLDLKIKKLLQIAAFSPTYRLSFFKQR